MQVLCVCQTRLAFMADHPLTVGTRHKHVPLATTANSYTTGSNRILPHGLAVSPQSPHPSLGGLSTTPAQLARKEKNAPYRKLFDTTRGYTQRGPRFERACWYSAVRAGIQAATRRAIWSQSGPPICVGREGPQPCIPRRRAHAPLSPRPTPLSTPPREPTD